MTIVDDFASINAGLKRLEAEKDDYQIFELKRPTLFSDGSVGIGTVKVPKGVEPIPDVFGLIAWPNRP